MPRVSRFLIVYNPASGRRRAERWAKAVNDCLRREGFESNIRGTTVPGDAERIAAEAVAAASASDRLCVVAAGGDGTVQELANAIVGHGTEKALLGVIPTGRCNDFARAFGLEGPPERIARLLASGHSTTIDLGRIGQRYFCTVAAVGFDAAVSRYVNEMKMPLRGPAAYVYGTLAVLLRHRTPTLRLSGDFGEYEGPVFMAATANTPWYGGAMHIAPQADALDGRLDVCLVTKISRTRVLRMLPKVMAGRHTELPEVRMLRTQRLTIEPVDDKSTVEVWADGEPITRAPVTIECVPSAIRLIVPTG